MASWDPFCSGGGCPEALRSGTQGFVRTALPRQGLGPYGNRSSPWGHLPCGFFLGDGSLSQMQLQDLPDPAQPALEGEAGSSSGCVGGSLGSRPSKVPTCPRSGEGPPSQTDHSGEKKSALDFKSPKIPSGMEKLVISCSITESSWPQRWPVPGQTVSRAVHGHGLVVPGLTADLFSCKPVTV